jgi:hypothetical protein
LRRLTGEEKRKSAIVCYKVNNFFHKRKHKRAKKRTLFARLRLFHSFFRPLSLSPSHDSARRATFGAKNASTFAEKTHHFSAKVVQFSAKQEDFL